MAGELPRPVALRLDHPAMARLAIIDAERGVVDPLNRRDKVAMIGFDVTSLRLAPFEDPSFECWGLNQVDCYAVRADRWFEMHQRTGPAGWLADAVRNTDYLGFLQRLPMPIYMVETHPDIPTSVRYPIERMSATFGTDVTFPDGAVQRRPFFTSTMAYMLALALEEGFKEIALYGISLSFSEPEYAEQRNCVEFFRGVAHARGVKFTIPAVSAVGQAGFRYGYDTPPDGDLLAVMDVRSRVLAASLVTQTDMVSDLKGRLDEIEIMRSRIAQKQRGGSPII